MIAGRRCATRALELARDLLADDRAHRAAHELEHEEADLDGDAADRRRAGAVGVAAGRPCGSCAFT